MPIPDFGNEEREPLIPSVDYGSIRGSHKPDAIKFSWNNITVKHPKLNKNIVDHASGEANPGDLLAIMGSSGAGKTSLLNALTFKNMADLDMTGSRYVNQELVTPNSITSVSAYVQQDDMFLGTLTVREHLIFQALVRMNPRLKYSERVARVDEVLTDLGLEKCKDTVIGTKTMKKGISGGEKKRLSFASEILTNPSILFCDEPTSGLDSYMAGHVVEMMREMANRGRTVITTIHQPSSILFSHFNKILLVAEGRTAYIGNISEANPFLASCGYPCPPFYNPADHFIETLTIVPSDRDRSLKKVAEICDKFNETEYGKVLAYRTHPNYQFAPVDTNFRSPYTVDWCAQFWALLWRGWLSVIREPKLIKVRLFQTIFISTLIGFLYHGQSLDQNGIVNINGVLFYMVTNLTYSNIFAVINVFCMELPLFLREHHNGMYRTDVYFLTKNLAEMPIFLLIPAMTLCICYFMIGLNPIATKFLIAVLILELMVQTVISYGYFMSCFCSTLPLAIGVSSPVILPLFLFGGMFLKNGSIPIWLDWIKYISWFFYSYEALVINQWSGVTNITCDEMMTDINLNLNVSSPDLQSPETSCIRTGSEVLESLNFHAEDFIFDIWMLVTLSVCLRVAAFLSLLLKTRRGKRKFLCF